MSRVGLLALFLVSLLFFSACGNKAQSPSDAGAEAVPVHPCDANAPDPFGVQASRLASTQTAGSPTGSNVVAPAATVADGSGFGSGLPGCDGPDFSQRCPLWGSLEYDHASGSDIGCGRTIAQCGCALTSAASLLLRYGVTRGPDGTPTTPKSLNDWFKQDTHQTSAGSLSRGYVYGAVNWLAVATYSKQAAAKFGTPSVTYNGNLADDLNRLKQELDNSRPVILEQPRHFVLATGEASSEVTIADPYYPDRTVLDTPAYHNGFVSGRLYRPGSDLSALMVAMPKGATRFSIVDQSGARTGFKPGQQTTVSDVKQSLFALEEAWQDPTCTASSPRADAGVAEATLLLPSAARYGIDLEGTPNAGYSFAVYAYDQAGGLVLQNFDGALPASGSAHYEIDYNPAPGSKQLITQAGPVATQPPLRPTTQSAPPGAATSTPAPAQSPVAVAPSVTPTRTSTPKPKPTATPIRTPTPSPAATLKITIAPTTLSCGDDQAFTLVTITAADSQGKPPQNTTVNLTTSRGTVMPSSVTLVNGSGSARVYPGPNPDATAVTITVTAKVTNVSLSTSASFTCETPIIIL